MNARIGVVAAAAAIALTATVGAYALSADGDESGKSVKAAGVSHTASGTAQEKANGKTDGRTGHKANGNEKAQGNVGGTDAQSRPGPAPSIARANPKPTSKTSAAAKPTKSKGKNVTGQMTGAIRILAPGKLSIDPHKGMGQILWIAYETKVVDPLGVLCEGRGQKLPYKCSGLEMEEYLTANPQSAYAKVTFDKGAAIKITGLVED
jgi:hypothetical protein